jgi:hypothetical protein
MITYVCFTLGYDASMAQFAGAAVYDVRVTLTCNGVDNHGR